MTRLFPSRVLAVLATVMLAGCLGTGPADRDTGAAAGGDPGTGAAPAPVLAAALDALREPAPAPRDAASEPAADAAPAPPGEAPPASAAGPPCARPVSTSAPIERLAGPDRYATAACVSATVYAGGADHVLLARGDLDGGLADALAGAVLAHAVSAPILLTEPGRLPEPTLAELRRLAPSKVTILGGTAAVSAEVARRVAATVPAVDRITGTTRYDTAAAVSARAGAGEVAFVVNGARPADSLVAAAPAARRGAALLLVSRDGVPPVTEAMLAGSREIVVVGGHGVVSESVEGALRRIAGSGSVRRVSGGTRAETAASVARAFPEPGIRYLSGQQDANLVDAATAGWAAARPGGGPVLYAERDRPGRGADRYLRLGGLGGTGDLAPSRLVGGRAVLSDALAAALDARYEEARAGGPGAEVRAMWVHLFDPVLKTRRGIHRMLDAAASANLNSVVVQVARRQDAYYRSSVLPRTVDPEMARDLDLLAELVPAARARGLAVHAWVSVLPAYHDEYEGLDLGPDHVWTRHGPGSADPWVTKHYDGRSGRYLDPGVPAVQDHVAAVAAELAGRGVDAVHVDYLRYESGAWGYHAQSLARFRAQTGATGVPEPHRGAWHDWRRRQTADLARRVFLEVAGVDPRVAVTIAASTMGAGPSSSGGYEQTRTYRDVFQDWPAWLADGRIDAAFPMNYFREGDARQRAWFDDWVRFEAALPRDRRLVAVGTAAYLNELEGSLAQVGRARAATDGVVLYSYQRGSASGDPGALLARLPAGLFAQPAPAPALVRRPDGAGHLSVRVADGVAVQVRPAGTGDAPAPVTADATGRAGLLFLPAGQWVASAPGYEPATVTVTAGEVTRVGLERP